MSKNIEIDGERWIQTPIKMVLQHVEHFHYQICLDLSDQKRVIVDYNEADTRKRLQSLLDKSIEHIFLREEDLIFFMKNVKSSLEQVKIEAGELSVAEIMSETCAISTCFEFMKSSFLQLGLNSQSLILAEEINRRTLKTIRHTPNLVELLRTMRNDLHPHFVRALLTGSMSICLVDFFSWGNDEINEKLSLGALMSQLNWEDRHYQIYENGTDHKELHNLPVQMASKLREAKIFPREVIEIVEQSFERPDGSGFPRALSSSAIGRLPAIHMVSTSFVKDLIAYDFDFSKRTTIVDNLKQRYNEGSFKPVMEMIAQNLVA